MLIRRLLRNGGASSDSDDSEFTDSASSSSWDGVDGTTTAKNGIPDEAPGEAPLMLIDEPVLQAAPLPPLSIPRGLPRDISDAQRSRRPARPRRKLLARPTLHLSSDSESQRERSQEWGDGSADSADSTSVVTVNVACSEVESYVRLNPLTQPHDAFSEVDKSVGGGSAPSKRILSSEGSQEEIVNVDRRSASVSNPPSTRNSDRDTDFATPVTPSAKRRKVVSKNVTSPPTPVSARFMLPEGVTLLEGAIDRSESDSRWGMDTRSSEGSDGAVSLETQLGIPPRRLSASLSSSPVVAARQQSPQGQRQSFAVSLARPSDDGVDSMSDTIIVSSVSTVAPTQEHGTASPFRASARSSAGNFDSSQKFVSLPSDDVSASLPDQESLGGVAPRAVLIDGSGLYFRAQTASSNKSAALPIFVASLLRVLDHLRPVHYAGIFFDLRLECTEKRVVWPRYERSNGQYKRNRASPLRVSELKKNDGSADETRKSQAPSLTFLLVKEACEALGLFCLFAPMFEARSGDGQEIVEMWEADDVLGSCACTFSEHGFQVSIVANDKDLLQCIAPRVCVCSDYANANGHPPHIGCGSVCVMVPFAAPNRGSTSGDRVSTRSEFFENDHGVLTKPALGVRAVAVTAFLALAGDAVDGVPGVPGIGPEIARLLCNTFGYSGRDVSLNTPAARHDVLLNIQDASKRFTDDESQFSNWIYAQIDTEKLTRGLRIVCDEMESLEQCFDLVSLKTYLDLRDSVEVGLGLAGPPVARRADGQYGESQFDFLCSRMLFRGSGVLRHFRSEDDAPFDSQAEMFSSFMERQYLDTGQHFMAVQRSIRRVAYASSKLPSFSRDEPASAFLRLTSLPGFSFATTQRMWCAGLRSLPALRHAYGLGVGVHDQEPELYRLPPALSPAQKLSVQYADTLGDRSITRDEVQLHGRTIEWAIRTTNAARREHNLPVFDVRVVLVGDYRLGLPMSREVVALLVCGSALKSPALALQAIVDTLVSATYVRGSFPLQSQEVLCQHEKTACCFLGGCEQPRRDTSSTAPGKPLPGHELVEWHGLGLLSSEPFLAPSPKTRSPRKRTTHEVHSPASLTPSESQQQRFDSVTITSSEQTQNAASGTKLPQTAKVRLVSLVAIPLASQGAAELHYTGPSCYTAQLRALARKQGYFLCRHMLAYADVSGLPVGQINTEIAGSTMSERDICEVFGQGAAYRAPEHRGRELGCPIHGMQFRASGVDGEYVSSS